jgi:hypothetical protein
MKKKSTLKSGIAVIALSLLALASCKKNDTEGLVTTLAITSKGGNDTTTVGNAITFAPTVTTKNNVTYSWTVNGVQKGTGSTFTYKPESGGDYQIAFKVIAALSSDVINYKVHVYAKYENGFFVANEGWFGHGTGTLSFYRFNTHTKEDSIFEKENPGKNLEPKTSSLEYGTIYNNKLVLVSKSGGPVVVADASSLKQLGRIPAAGGNNWMAFVGVSDTKGLLSSADGIYPFDLTTYTTGTKLAGVSGTVGDLIKAGNYVFALSETDGVVVINAATNAVVKKIAGMDVAFAKTPDGSVWAAGGTSLIKINPSTLAVTTVTLPFTAYGTWFAWHPGSITASTKTNTVYIANNGMFSGATTIYKYDGTAASVQTPLITIPTGKELYGAGLKYIPQTDQLAVTTVESGYGAHYAVNNLYFYNTSGALANNLAYAGYYFPATPFTY